MRIASLLLLMLTSPWALALVGSLILLAYWLSLR